MRIVIIGKQHDALVSNVLRADKQKEYKLFDI